jgi:hypothetical protein
MPNVILHKRSSTPAATPTPEQLALGELALNTADGTGFIKTDAGAIIDIRRPVLCDGGEIISLGYLLTIAGDTITDQTGDPLRTI